MLNFEEVDKIETFFGLNKGMIWDGINRIIMEFKCECDPHGRKEPSGINRIIMEFKYWNQAVL